MATMASKRFPGRETLGPVRHQEVERRRHDEAAATWLTEAGGAQGSRDQRPQVKCNRQQRRGERAGGARGAAAIEHQPEQADGKENGNARNATQKGEDLVRPQVDKCNQSENSGQGKHGYSNRVVSTSPNSWAERNPLHGCPVPCALPSGMRDAPAQFRL